MTSKRKATSNDEPPPQPMRSAYLLFHQEEREKELEANGTVDFLEFAKLVGKKWNEKSDSFKAAYDRRCAEMQIKWFHDLARWGAEHGGKTEYVQPKKTKESKAKKAKGEESEVEEEPRPSKKPQATAKDKSASVTPSKQKAQTVETPSKSSSAKATSSAPPPSGGEKKKKSKS